jgi:hypothetical protein
VGLLAGGAGLVASGVERRLDDQGEDCKPDGLASADDTQSQQGRSDADVVA